MPWTNQSEGPWGSGKGPWGSGPQQAGPTPPDLEEILRRGQDRLRRFLPGGGMGGRGFAMLAMAAHMMIQEGKLGPQAQPKPNDSSDQQRR